MTTDTEKHGRYTLRIEGPFDEDRYRCDVEVAYPEGLDYRWGSEEEPPGCYTKGTVQYFTAGYASAREEAFELGRRWIVLQQQKPFTVEWKMQYSFHAYPSISPTRWSVLDHLFFTLGNGIAWLDGQLVPKDISLLAMEDVLEGARCERESFLDYRVALREHDKDLYNAIEERLETRADLEKLWWRPSMIEGVPDDESLVEHVRHAAECYYSVALRSWYENAPRPLDLPDGWLNVYPFGHVCAIWKMPDDVQDDWLSAGWEALHLAATRGFEASTRLQCRQCAPYLWDRFGERLVRMGEVPWHIDLPVDDGKDHDYLRLDDYYTEKQAALLTGRRVEAYREYLAKIRANPDSANEYVPMDAVL